MHISTSFTFDTVDFSKENDIHAVVTIKAPKLDWQAKRAPICVIPVIDVSDSMAGLKLEYAKQTVIKLIDNLAPGDYCGLAVFSSIVLPIAAPREMTQASRDSLKLEVRNLRPNGSTDFAGGMRQGLEWLNALDAPDNMVLRVIMLTDGQANVGEAHGRDLIPLCKKLLGRATLSTFGYGDGCDHDLLGDIAVVGKGNYAFIKNPDDALTAFAKELGGLLSRYAQDIVIEVSPHGSHKLEEVLSDVEVEEDGDKLKIKLPEMLSEEERHIVLAIKTATQTKVLPRPLNVIDVQVSYDQLTSGDKIHKSETVKGKVEFVAAADAQKDPTKGPATIVALAQLVQAQLKAEEQAKLGNYAAAQDFFLPIRNNVHLGAAGQAVAASVSAFYTDNRSYITSSGSRNSLKKGLTRSAGMVDLQTVQLLDSVGMASGNEAMDMSVASFTGGAVPAKGTLIVPSTCMPSIGVPPVPSGAPGVSARAEAVKKAKSKAKKKSGRW